MSAFPETPTALLTRIASELSGSADEAAWSEFFELYEPAMQHFLERRGCADAADVVQVVFGKLVDILRSRRYDRSRGPFRAYLSTLLHHEMITYLRHERARGAGKSVPIDNVELPTANDPSLPVDMDWRLSFHEAIVRHVLSHTALSASSKAIFEELERTGDSCAEVARRHGLTPEAVRQVRSRVNRLVETFERRYGGLS